MSVYPRFSDDNQVTAWIVDESTTDAATNSLLQMIHFGTVDPKKYNHAAIRYNCDKGLDADPDNNDHYALIFSSTKGDVAPLYISGVTAGEIDEGSNATLKCLEYMDFEVNDKVKHRVTTKPIVNGNESSLIRIDFFRGVKPRTPFLFGRPPDF